MDGTLFGKKYDIISGEGGGGSNITLEVFDSHNLLKQSGIHISKTKTISKDSWLFVNIGGMLTGPSFKINGVEHCFTNGYDFLCNELIPVYEGDTLEFTVNSNGSNDNLISTIIIISGLIVPSND